MLKLALRIVFLIPFSLLFFMACDNEEPPVDEQLEEELENTVKKGNVSFALNDMYSFYLGHATESYNPNYSFDHYNFEVGFSDGSYELTSVPVPPNPFPNIYVLQPGAGMELKIYFLVPMDSEEAMLEDGSYPYLSEADLELLGSNVENELLIWNGYLELFNGSSEKLTIVGGAFEIKSQFNEQQIVSHTYDFDLLLEDGAELKGNFVQE